MPFCMQSKNHGDSIHWLRLEIMGFYANILVLVFYLVTSRLDKDAAASHIEMADQIYSDDFRQRLEEICCCDIRLIDCQNEDNYHQVLHRMNCPDDDPREFARQLTSTMRASTEAIEL